MTNYLVIEYKGEEYQRFIPLVKHLFRTEGIEDYALFKGKDEEKVQVFIHVSAIPVEEAERYLSTLSDKLKTRVPKRWKTLPSTMLPEAYNIVTLPYKQLT